MCLKRTPRFLRMFLSDKERHAADVKVYVTSPEGQDQEVDMSKKEILTKYRLHIFVAVIFTITLLFVSVGWYYRDKTREEDLSNQKIFVDPRRRIMTLDDEHDEVNVRLGQDLPRWQLPLHCPIHMEGNPNSKECVWKDNAILRVDYFLAASPDGGSTAHCYNVSWETLRLPRVPHDCFDVGGAVWYGPSNQSQKTWPIEGSFSYIPSPNQLSNNGIFGSVADLYWLSSSGVGLLLNADNPLTLHWNDTMANHLCVVSNYSGPLYGLHQEGRLPHMNYTLCNGPNARATHEIMKGFLRGTENLKPLPRDMFTGPFWSVKGIARKDDYGQQEVHDLVDKLKTHGLNCSLLMLDGEWQANLGDLDFDPERFANLTDMTDHAQNTCALGLEVTPYFDYRSAVNFHEGVDKDLLVRDAGGDVPGLTRRHVGGAVAMLDVSRAESRVWFNSLMTKVVGRSKARAVRLSYGQDGWLPYKPTFSDPEVSVFQLRRMMTEMAARYTDRLIVQHSSGSQNVPSFFAVPTDVTIKDGRSCLSGAIEKALTLGLLGYPYVMADGFSVSKKGHSHISPLPTRDLFTRWLQMAVFFPAYKFSVPPWMYDENTIEHARNLSRLHTDLVVPTIFQKEVLSDVASGLPIMRPSWWLDPGNRTLHALHVHDQFLIGDTLLVAPVMCEGMTHRSIYIPDGVWDDKLRGAYVIGPQVIADYHVNVHEVPHFVKMKTYEDLRG